MKILSVKVGPPTDDYSAWVRKIKIAGLMKSMGHKVDFVIYSWSDELNQDILDQIPVNYEIIKVSKLNFLFKHNERLKKKEYDLVFCNGQFTHALLSLTRKKSIPLMLDRHGDMLQEYLLLEDDFHYHPKFLVWYFYLKLITILNFRFADIISCVSHKMVDYLSQEGFNSDNLYYVTNGIDHTYFQKPDPSEVEELRNDLNLSQEMVFTYLGAHEKWQGVDNLKIAAEKLKGRENVAFVIVGGSDDYQDGNIRYVSKVSPEKVSLYYSLSDVLLLPRPSHLSTEVAAPTKFPEYLAMEKPILTTNVGDAASLVEEYQCGIVVKDNNPENIINGLQKFMGLSKSELKVMGQNSLRLAKKEFTIDKMAQDLNHALNSTVKG